MMTGNTHPRLANDDVVNLIIPIPDLATQTTIASEVRRRREQARALRAEAETGWVEAKRSAASRRNCSAPQARDIFPAPLPGRMDLLGR